MLANLADLADRAHRALVLGMVFGPVKGAFLVCRSAVNRCVASSANLKFRKLVELDLYRVMRVALTLRLRFLGLKFNVSRRGGTCPG